VGPAALAEADGAVERLLPRFGVPVARRRAVCADVDLHYLEAGSGPAVVLLHGGFGGAGNWYRLSTGEAPGEGLRWLREWLTALGVQRAALVGHAAGGALALAFAQAYPGVAGALVLGDLALVTADAAPGDAPRAARPPRRVESWYPGVAARFDDRRLLVPEYLYYLWCLARLRPVQDQRPPGDLAPGPVRLPAPGARTWPTVPMLLVWGRGNRWSGVPLVRQLHERIPDAWLRVIEHSKGIPQLEQPGEYNFAAINFLRHYLERG
jgi:pimeloyl-ACP methyl ester carboxylesterase